MVGLVTIRNENILEKLIVQNGLNGDDGGMVILLLDCNPEIIELTI